MISEPINKKQLIDWIEELSDTAMLQTLQSLKESSEGGKDFWQELPDGVKQAINLAKEELDGGTGIAHTDVMEQAKRRFLQI